MFIQTEATPNPETLNFLPGERVIKRGTVEFPTRADAERSPLAKRLHAIDGVTSVLFGADCITVTKADDQDWALLKPPILGAIMDHFTSGQPVIEDEREDVDDEPGIEALEPVSDAPQEKIDQVKELIATRLQPGIRDMGGDVAFHSFAGTTVNLHLQGAAYGMVQQIENMLMHLMPEIDKVQDVMDAIPKPGLDTPIGKAVREVLDTRITPAGAAPGGHIALVDVQGKRVILRLEGGCQGCGMASVTLRQGVEAEIRSAAPEVEEVLDVTDHASGSNPYFQPGKGGASASM
jgi:Fe-S cluster biogenesis protein NfuA